MARFPVSPDREAELLRWMAELGIDERDIDERFIRGSGAGGQKINKTSSCVTLKHLPSGIEVRCQQERSQALNRFTARRLLCERLSAVIAGEASAAQQEREKVRRQKRRRSRRAKAKMVAGKRHRAGIKSTRGAVRGGE